MLAALLGTAGIAQAQLRPPPAGSPIDRIAPTAPPRVGAPVPTTTPTAPSPTPDAALRVESFGFDGATAYPDSQLRALTGDITGALVPLARIEQARLAILDRYRADGFAFTTVTAVVDAGAGAVRFNVVEGYINEVRLDGDIGPAATQVLRFLNRLTEERPIRNATLERWLLLAQDVPGVGLRAILRPSASEPGALQLVAQLTRRPFSFLGTIDNRGYELTGPEQGLVVVSANSFTEFGERTDFSQFHAAGNTQWFSQAATEFFLGGTGLRGRIYGGLGRAQPSGDLRRIGYLSDTYIGGISLGYPVVRSRSEAVNLSLALDYFESRVRTSTSAGRSVLLGEDSFLTARLNFDWARQDNLLGEARAGVTAMTVRLSQGLEGLAGSRTGDELAGRLNQRVDFFKVNGEISRSQTLLEIDDVTFGVLGIVTGQWTDDVLPSSEKFFLGGNRIGRGFYAGEATGDRGIAGTIELQLTGRTDIEYEGESLAVGWQGYAFMDRGWARPEQRFDPEYRISTLGLGLRLTLNERLQINGEWVHRLTRRLEGTNPRLPPLGRNAYYWQFLLRF